MKERIRLAYLLVAATMEVICSCRNTVVQAPIVDALDESIYENVPFEMSPVEYPVFPDYEVSVEDFGAKGDGITLNTEAINNAIKAVNKKGGGRVTIPAGIWLTGPIQLMSDVNLYTDYNSLILFSDDYTLYPIIKTSYEGLDVLRCTSPIWARNAENVAITGHGIFDGNGDNWRPVKRSRVPQSQWEDFKNSGGVVDERDGVWYPTLGSLKGAVVGGELDSLLMSLPEKDRDEFRPWLRPVLLSIVKSKRVLIEGVTFRNSPAWCLHPLSCKHVIIDNIFVVNPGYAQNSDALDIESCDHVLVLHSIFDAGDDAICIKSGRDEDGRRRDEPCQNVIVKDNLVLNGHGAFVIGSEMSGGVKKVYVSDNIFMDSDVGIRLKSARGRGGVVEDVFVDAINMYNIHKEALLIDLFFSVNGIANTKKSKDFAKAEDDIPPVTEGTPVFRNIHISNVSCEKAGQAIYFKGLPEMPISNVSVRNVSITGANSGIYIDQVDGAKLENVYVQARESLLKYENAKGLVIDGKAMCMCSP